VDGRRRDRIAVSRHVRTLALALGAWWGTVAMAEASNDALLRLLEVLRDRGSITAAEYEEVRKVADLPERATPDARVTAVEARVAAQETSLAALKTATDGAVPPLVNKALAGKWYERIGLRGYTQFRYADVMSHDGLPIDVPADRSVNEAESFVIRRGRFIFSGDATERLALYAQFDFNGSTGAADYSLQMRDLYADFALDKAKDWRVRLGQSKVPFGWVNLQSSQNRAPLERPDALNSAVEGERDLGAYLMWAPAEARRRFRDLTAQGLKGSGDYGVVAIGAYAGQGLNRSDQNGDVHVLGRVSYPFKLKSGQLLEVGIQGYHGRFVSPVQAISVGGVNVTPSQRADGVLDQRVAVTAVYYPQPFGIEAEWTAGRGPALSTDQRTVELDSLQGGYLQFNYRHRNAIGTWLPFGRWNYFDGARKFARNAPRATVNELDFGVEFARWAELELTGMYTRTVRRTRTSTYPYGDSEQGDRLGVQVQWNY
jgi:hypothetical protein